MLELNIFVRSNMSSELRLSMTGNITENLLENYRGIAHEKAISNDTENTQRVTSLEDNKYER